MVSITVLDPNLQTRGRPGYPDPKISGGGFRVRVGLNFFSPLGLILVIISFLKWKKMCIFIGLLYKLSFLAEK